tara:strand:+ start:356 stop:781 length:426 start_codon:yes stop_codon:yes gene_type:complete
MNTKTKKVLDNSHTTQYGTTYDQLHKVIENMQLGEYLKIEYNKIPNRQTEHELIESVEEELNQLTLSDFNDGKHRDILTYTLREHKGELKTVYYQRAEAFRNVAGYLLFKDESDQWKSVDIRNIISITNIDGIKRTRNAQR